MVSQIRTVEAESADVPLESGALYHAHAQRVARWISRLGGPGIDVEDLVQDVFVRVHQHLPSFRGEAQVTTWLYRITQNVVISRRRKDRLRRFFGVSVEQKVLEQAPEHLTPFDSLQQQRSAQLLYAALDGMAEKYRSPLILFEIEGLAGEEIAALTGVKLATLWVRLNRARAQLLERVEKLQRKEPRGRSS